MKRVELQACIAEIQLEVRTGKYLRLAASAGASVFPHDGTTYEALLADADQRMYRDKAARRGEPRPPEHVPDAEFVPAQAIDPDENLVARGS